MSSFTKQLSITKIKVRKRKFWAFLFKEKYKLVDRWRLNKTFGYVADDGEVIYVPKGFITDGASIPKFLWAIVGHPMGEYAQAAVVHDFLYTSYDKLIKMGLYGPWKIYKYTRLRCDQIFYEAMEVLDVAYVKRIAMYNAVKMFGGKLWRKRKKDVDNN